MIKKTLSTALLIGGLSFISILPASATKPDPAHKDYVCKYVGKPGVNERLQTGQNPIWVDTAATTPGWYADLFKDAQHSYVIVADTLRLDPEPGIDKCAPVVQPPVEPPVVVPPVVQPPVVVPPVVVPVVPPVVAPPVVVPPVVVPPVAVVVVPKTIVHQVKVAPKGGIQTGDGSTVLARTGFDSAPLFGGLGLLLAGIVLLVGKRLTLLRK